MSLDSSYELLEMLRDDGVQTFRGKEIATGRSLEIHLFVPFGRPDNKPLFEKLKTLPLETRRQFLEMGWDGSTPYVVTDPIPDGRGFRAWAESLLAGSKPSPMLVAPPENFPLGQVSGPRPDDSVQILQAGQWRTGTPIPDSLVSHPPPPPPPPREPTVPRMPTGDITMMFHPGMADLAAAAENEAKPSGGQVEPGMWPPEKRQPEPGEFTRMFQASTEQVAPQAAKPAPIPAAPASTPAPTPASIQTPAPPPAQSPSPAGPGHEPGEFTRMFQTPDLTHPGATPFSPPPPPPATAHPVSPLESSSEFSGLFQAPPRTAPQTPNKPPQQDQAGEFTKFFESPLQPTPLSSQKQDFGLPKDMPPPPPPKRAGDFTEVFGRPSSPDAHREAPLGQSFAPPPPPVGGTGTGGFGGASATAVFSSPSQRPSAPPAGSFPSGPSEYTRMISSAAAPTLGQAPPAPPMAAPAAKKPMWILYVALGVLVVLVILVILFFVLRHK